MPKDNTIRVFNSTPREYTLRVESAHMKTVGERIRQAREAKGMSGDHLAKLVGYKHQSGIGNLENRATGAGGKKIAAIAAALNISADWLLSGPDSQTVPFISGSEQAGIPSGDFPGDPSQRLAAVPSSPSSPPDWPFSFPIEELRRLRPEDRARINAYVVAIIETRRADASKTA